MYWFCVQSTLNINENTQGPEIEEYEGLYYFRQSIPTNRKHFANNVFSGKT